MRHVDVFTINLTWKNIWRSNVSQFKDFWVRPNKLNKFGSSLKSQKSMRSKEFFLEYVFMVELIKKTVSFTFDGI